MDASVLVSILTNDAHSERARRWFSNLDANFVISDLATLETAAVISRRSRVDGWGPGAVGQVLSGLDVLKAGCERRFHDPSNFALAEALVRDLETKLAAADALHLATAKADGAILATFDSRLADAARANGVEVAAIG